MPLTLRAFITNGSRTSSSSSEESRQTASRCSKAAATMWTIRRGSYWRRLPRSSATADGCRAHRTADPLPVRHRDTSRVRFVGRRERNIRPGARADTAESSLGGLPLSLAAAAHSNKRSSDSNPDDGNHQKKHVNLLQVGLEYRNCDALRRRLAPRRVNLLHALGLPAVWERAADSRVTKLSTERRSVP